MRRTQLVAADADAIETLFLDPEAIRRFGGMQPVRTWLPRALAMANQETWLGWINDDLIGLVTIEHEEPETACVAVLIAAHWRGQGRAQQLLQHVISRTSAKRVIAEVEPDNAGGLRVAQAIGLTPVGISDEGFHQLSGTRHRS
jgi:RimJ/RimL family protein N-acetyltransferase